MRRAMIVGLQRRLKLQLPYSAFFLAKIRREFRDIRKDVDRHEKVRLLSRRKRERERGMREQLIEVYMSRIRLCDS